MTDVPPTPDPVLSHLSDIADQAGPLRRRRHTRYDAGHAFDLEVTGVCPARPARVRMTVEKFIGGGFAGQVYRVRLDGVDAPDGPPEGLEVGRQYAVKIIIPPSAFSLAFRNATYAVAYQGPFSAQVHPAAARTGVLWQKLIRRAAAIEFGRDDAVCDTYATFYDEGLGSWGEINEWVAGRTWKFELDEHIFDRRPPAADDPEPDFSQTGAAEYYAKKHFMRRFVCLLHRMGAPELARQYEWWTCKSQPNVLKRLEAGDGPADGLTAIDFRAGLALMPFLPMSPGDIPLIWNGLRHGRLVQFDRGDLEQLAAFIDKHAERFDDLRPALQELREVDPAYRRSLIDVTHNGLKAVTSREHRTAVRDGFIHDWKAKALVDDAFTERLRKSPAAFAGFFALRLVSMVLSLCVLLGGIRWVIDLWRGRDTGRAEGQAGGMPWAAILGTLGIAVGTLILLRLIPAAVGLVRRLWGDRMYRLHLGAMLKKRPYFVRVLHARQAEILMDWHRAARRAGEACKALATSPWAFWPQQLLLAPLPPWLHRFVCEPGHAWHVIKRKVGGLVLFIKDAEFRRQWLEAIIDEGHRDGVLSEEEHARLREQASDPYIKTYLLCLAGHFATLPVTQVISVIVAIWAYYNLGKGWEESFVYALGVLAAFQLTPISPGSFCRGLIATGVMIAKRNWHDFRVAVSLSFWKYIGYLAFPIQMVTTYPALSRLMAGRWASGLVSSVPVFGERGALLEHAVLDQFFNKPVSIRRRIHDGHETTGRLVTKIALFIVWFLASALATLWMIRLDDPDALASAEQTWKAWRPVVAGGLAALAVVPWAARAPRFALIRKVWWLLAAVPAAVAAKTLIDYWPVLAG